jgi:hypothetical protein
MFPAVLFCLGPVFGQDIEREAQKVFIRAVIYPTYSLSRYDYNNDLNNTEIRAYVNLRLGSPHGEIIPDAEVSVNGGKLPFKENNYEKRIQIDPENLAETVTLDIETPAGFSLSRTFPIPNWLVIAEPQPSILEADSGIELSWSFGNNNAAADVRVYHFRTGDEILSCDYFDKRNASIPAESIQADSLLRIYVISSWIYKKYIRGDNISKGSEMNIVPWSQVFIRTK